MDRKIVITACVSFFLGSALTYFVKDYRLMKKQQEMARRELERKKKNNPLSRMNEIMEQMMGGGLIKIDPPPSMDDNEPIKIKQSEDQDYVYLEVQGQGIDKEKINIKISDGMIQIDGEVEKEEGGAMMKSSFSKAFSPPFGTDLDNVDFDTGGDKIIIKLPKVAK